MIKEQLMTLFEIAIGSVIIAGGTWAFMRILDYFFDL